MRKKQDGANTRQVGGRHYKSQYEHWDWVEDMGMGYLEGVATKYVARWRKKDGLQDLEKSLHYVQKLEELYGSSIQRKNRNDVAPRKALKLTTDFCTKNELTPTEAAIMHELAMWKGLENLHEARRLIQGLLDGAQGIEAKNKPF